MTELGLSALVVVDFCYGSTVWLQKRWLISKMDFNLKAFCLYCNSDDNTIIKPVISVQFVVQLFLLQALKLVMPSISAVFVTDASHYYQYAEVLLVSLYEHKFKVFLCMISA